MCRQKNALFLLVWVILVTSCADGIQTQVHTNSTLVPTVTRFIAPKITSTSTIRNECIKSFKNFVIPPDNLFESSSNIAPLYPWQVEATIPGPVETFPIILTRIYDGHQEIWVGRYVYEPETGQWREEPPRRVFSKKTEESAVVMMSYFVTSDGSVWGKNYWHSGLNGAIVPNSVPVLSKYNESTRLFEFAQGVLEIPVDPAGMPNKVNWPEIVLDSNDIFWIFHTDGNIYRYDPDTEQTQKQETSMPELLVHSASLAPDGSFYLQKSEKPDWEIISNGDFLRFFPQTGEIVPLNAPDSTWPVVMQSSMLVDHAGRLWLDTLGYRELDGKWFLIHPRIDEYSTNLGTPQWSSPVPQLESSDGILWFYRYTGIKNLDGTAWYDPKTGTGCLFTNIPARVVEDSDRNLWLVADGKLYKYKLIQ